MRPASLRLRIHLLGAVVALAYLAEAFLSYALESKFSKEEIFALYCNEVYLGQSGTYAVHGFAEAAQRFFGKDLAALTPDEAALLAGLVRAPSANSPYRHPERAKARRDLVLQMMAEAGHLTPEQAAEAAARPITLAPVTRNSAWLDAPYFDDYARAQRRASHDYLAREDWSRRAILNVARVGRFSSDRVIREYATETWKLTPVG